MISSLEKSCQRRMAIFAPKVRTWRRPCLIGHTVYKRTNWRLTASWVTLKEKKSVHAFLLVAKVNQDRVTVSWDIQNGWIRSKKPLGYTKCKSRRMCKSFQTDWQVHNLALVTTFYLSFSPSLTLPLSLSLYIYIYIYIYAYFVSF